MSHKLEVQGAVGARFRPTRVWLEESLASWAGRLGAGTGEIVLGGVGQGDQDQKQHQEL